MTMVAGQFDPIAIEVQWNRLISIMDEVDIALVRTAFSTIVGESRDFAVILLDRQGRSIAQSRLSSPAFTVTLPATTKHLLAAFPADTLAPGDVLITNDPWLGAGHLPDLNIVSPVFYQGQVVAFMAAVAHVADIGGRLDFFDARDMYEEGFCIPPSKLHIAGRENTQLLRLLATNVRVPDMVLGDVNAIVGAEKLGRDRLLEFLADYGGVAGLDALAEEILTRSDRAIRDALRKLPDGTWRYGVDADGYRSPLRIEVAITKTGDRIELDYSGSSQQFTDGSINCVPNITFADSYYPIKCSLAPDIPNNEGLFKAITVRAPLGSVFNTTKPSPVRSRSKSSFNIHVAIYGALSGIIPDRVQAGSGAFWSMTLHGHHADDGSAYNVHILPWGGKGATPRADGLPTIAFPYNGTVTPIEIIENQAPVRVCFKRFVPDSGGPGRFRGGLGQEIAIRIDDGEALIASLRPDKVRYPPTGILGGQPGQPGAFTINDETFTVEPRHLHGGDVYLIRMPGGGGYGAPAERARASILHDIEQGYVTQDASDRTYGPAEITPHNAG